MRLGEGEQLKPTGGVGGAIQEQEKALLREIDRRVNYLFEGVTEQAASVYVNNVLMEKLLEMGMLAQQATNNSQGQLAASPILDRAMTNAMMEMHKAHALMRAQALGSPRVMDGLKDILLNGVGMYKSVPEHAGGGESAV